MDISGQSAVNKSKVLKKWIASHPRLLLNYMPRYPTDNNPQDWWNHVRKKLHNNHYSEFKRRQNDVVLRFIRNTQPCVVKSVCSISAIEHLLKQPCHL